MTRISILDKDRCQPKKCDYLCINYCPGVRMDEDTIVIDEDTKKPLISEELCEGCGICTNRCPFDAITIINLPEAAGEPIHRFGQNQFELFGLPSLEEGTVLGLLGQNGIGKSTIMNILSGNLIPNFGDFENAPENWDNVIEYYKGSALQKYFQDLSEGNIKTILKPQMVDKLPKVVKGKVKDLLTNVNERDKLDYVTKELQLENVLDRKMENLSGGELQRVAIAATVLREGDFYYFDEPTSWLDVSQRLNAVKVIRSLAEEGKSVLVIEHDLATLDALSDNIHILYGTPGGYGVVSGRKGVRLGINAYIKGFLAEENVRIRRNPIEFTIRPPTPEDEGDSLASYSDLSKDYDGFKLSADEGEIFYDEIVTAFGSNGIGKTTFAKMLAGAEEPTTGEVDEEVEIAYKPQYIVTNFEGTVSDFLYMNAPSFGSKIFESEIMNPLTLNEMLDKPVKGLSGGELQRLAIAATLAKDAEIYLFDEPTAFLDVEQRLIAARVIRKLVESRNAASLIVDHDIVFIDYISDRAMVFDGTPGLNGHASKPTDLRNAMNEFLGNLNITFRRDKETKRPRVNKLDSYKDREQKEKGEYYYLSD
ncbi:ribosome biogenesis/translation initiation ATPase RLI [Methanobrevibacter sp.]|uniref:ribosome biogenesis/translation initiation ATPase RLI n=1 Tax=Methanobrevibacter sp. TaxID=66852 RepID=UPI0025CF96BA|nr:ribosome biogenesis/translation initiation ATPase RLI [Methanobrevibacter sp.]MBQ2831793.1 ribosome biogenesis/translation initiation ATPase RLI [Methanobrevibacter sp.]